MDLWCLTCGVSSLQVKKLIDYLEIHRELFDAKQRREKNFPSFLREHLWGKLADYLNTDITNGGREHPAKFWQTWWLKYAGRLVAKYSRLKKEPSPSETQLTADEVRLLKLIGHDNFQFADFGRSESVMGVSSLTSCSQNSSSSNIIINYIQLPSESCYSTVGMGKTGENEETNDEHNIKIESIFSLKEHVKTKKRTRRFKVRRATDINVASEESTSNLPTLGRPKKPAQTELHPRDSKCNKRLKTQHQDMPVDAAQRKIFPRLSQCNERLQAQQQFMPVDSVFISLPHSTSSNNIVLLNFPQTSNTQSNPSCNQNPEINSNEVRHSLPDTMPSSSLTINPALFPSESCSTNSCSSNLILNYVQLPLESCSSTGQTNSSSNVVNAASEQLTEIISSSDVENAASEHLTSGNLLSSKESENITNSQPTSKPSFESSKQTNSSSDIVNIGVISTFLLGWQIRNGVAKAPNVYRITLFYINFLKIFQILGWQMPPLATPKLRL